MEPSIVFIVYAPPSESHLSGSDVEQAMREAAKEWESSCSTVRIDVRTSSGAPRVRRDGVNAVVVRSNRWCPDSARLASECYDHTLHAQTQLRTGADASDVTSGRIAEADIEINAVDYRWNTGADQQQNSYNLKATLVHEIGHALGLAHDCRLVTLGEQTDNEGKPLPLCSTPQAKRSAMYLDPQEAGRTLVLEPTESERRAMCTLYPSKVRSCACSSVRPGPTLAPLATWVISFLLFMRRRACGIHSKELE